MEDRELIDKFLSGHKEYFDSLVLKYKGMVFNICFRMLGDYEEALDVSQDIFLKVYHSLRDFRHESAFSTYLYRISMNFCKNRLKALARRRQKEPFSMDAPVVTEKGLLKREVADKAANPREAAQGREREEIVAKALNSLKDEYKEIIVLREIEGLAYEDISGILNIDLGTVKSRLSRARASLKEKLEGKL